MNKTDKYKRINDLEDLFYKGAWLGHKELAFEYTRLILGDDWDGTTPITPETE